MPILAGAGVPTTSATATAGGMTLTVAAEDALGRLRITVTGGVAGQPLYVLRRDSAGTALVRPTSAGTLLWLAGTPTTVPVFYENEARQGLPTDFVATDLNGTPVVSVRVTVPTWGTWLKSPGKPHLNMRVVWHNDSEYDRPLPRTLLQPRGAKYPVALTDRRTAPSGVIVLQTETDVAARSLIALADDGQTLMIDTPESYGVPIRYVSVGNLSGARMAGAVRIDMENRIWTLEVDEVAVPVGLPAGQGFTYTGLAATADSYVGLAATYLTYSDMSVGINAS